MNSCCGITQRYTWIHVRVTRMLSITSVAIEPLYMIYLAPQLRRSRKRCRGRGPACLAVQLLAGSHLLLLAFAVLIFDIPRYTLSLVSLALFGAWRSGAAAPAGRASVSVILPTFNGGDGLNHTIVSLQRQTLPPVEIIVVDDGSTDETRAVAERARAQGLVDMVIAHGTRCGRSAAINAAARFASGDLLLTADADTEFEPTALCAACGRVRRSSRWRRELQHRDPQRERVDMDRAAERRVPDVDQRRAVDPRRRRMRSPACPAPARCIAATCSFARAGSTSGPARTSNTACGCAALVMLIRFVPDAWAETHGPASAIGLLRQRARWDRDALRIRFMTYGEWRFFHPFEPSRTPFRGWTSSSSISFPRSACRSISFTSC